MAPCQFQMRWASVSALDSGRVTPYAFSRGAPRKSGPAGSRSQESRKSEARICTSQRRVFSMQDMPESLSDRYADLLTGSYDCVDRIVLNGYFRMGHDPG